MSRPSSTHLTNRLRHLALASSPITALFFARLFHAFVPPNGTDHESLHLLAQCFCQVGEPYSALYLVRDSAEPNENARTDGCYACAMIVAQCCQKLGRHSEGKAVLERALKRGSPSVIPTPCPASTSASAHLTLASLSHKGKAPEQAVEHYTKALNEDPWLWEAFTGLCDIGSPPPIDSIFPDPPAPVQAALSRTSRPPTLSPNPMPRSSASEMPGLAPLRRQLSPLTNGGPVMGNGHGHGHGHGHTQLPGNGAGFFTPDVVNELGMSRLGMMGNSSSWETPSALGDTTFPVINTQAPAAPSRRQIPNLISSFTSSASAMLPTSFRSTTTPANASEFNGPKAPPAMKRPRGGGVKKPVETPVNGIAHAHGRDARLNGRDLRSIEPNGESDAPVTRRSTRLHSTSKPVPVKNVNITTRDKRGTRSRSATSSSAGAQDTSSPPSQETQLQSSADDWLRDIVRRCARAYRALSMYKCQEALREIDTLPVELQHSPWALDIVARSFYEMANYVLARRAWKSLLAMEPYRLQSTEQYSTLLWHLGDSPALAHLSQHLISINRESPQPWIASGNCFSLSKDHDEAMRCLRRATQIDPGCAYAWTLCGYEAVEMEEYERAIAFYRTAIRTDSRHYNAWYGMGLVYLKMGKPKHAEHHFRRAAEINPTNAVLLCCIGMVLEQSDDIVHALDVYDQACKYAPESPMVAFKRIRVLVALSRIDEAINALEPLAREAPDEAQIHFLLGKCYLKQGRRGDATVAFTSARELMPKLEGGIRAAIEGRGEEEEEEE